MAYGYQHPALRAVEQEFQAAGVRKGGNETLEHLAIKTGILRALEARGWDVRTEEPKEGVENTRPDVEATVQRPGQPPLRMSIEAQVSYIPLRNTMEVKDKGGRGMQERTSYLWSALREEETAACAAEGRAFDEDGFKKASRVAWLCWGEPAIPPELNENPRRDLVAFDLLKVAPGLPTRGDFEALLPERQAIVLRRIAEETEDFVHDLMDGKWALQPERTVEVPVSPVLVPVSCDCAGCRRREQAACQRGGEPKTPVAIPYLIMHGEDVEPGLGTWYVDTRSMGAEYITLSKLAQEMDRTLRGSAYEIVGFTKPAALPQQACSGGLPHTTFLDDRKLEIMALNSEPPPDTGWRCGTRTVTIPARWERVDADMAAGDVGAGSGVTRLDNDAAREAALPKVLAAAGDMGRRHQVWLSDRPHNKDMLRRLRAQMKADVENYVKKRTALRGEGDRRHGFASKGSDEYVARELARIAMGGNGKAREFKIAFTSQ